MTSLVSPPVQLWTRSPNACPPGSPSPGTNLYHRWGLTWQGLHFPKLPGRLSSEIGTVLPLARPMGRMDRVCQVLSRGLMSNGAQEEHPCSS